MNSHASHRSQERSLKGVSKVSIWILEFEFMRWYFGNLTGGIYVRRVSWWSATDDRQEFTYS